MTEVSLIQAWPPTKQLIFKEVSEFEFISRLGYIKLVIITIYRIYFLNCWSTGNGRVIACRVISGTAREQVQQQQELAEGWPPLDTLGLLG